MTDVGSCHNHVITLKGSTDSRSKATMSRERRDILPEQSNAEDVWQRC